MVVMLLCCSIMKAATEPMPTVAAASEVWPLQLLRAACCGRPEGEQQAGLLAPVQTTS